MLGEGLTHSKTMSSTRNAGLGLGEAEGLRLALPEALGDKL